MVAITLTVMFNSSVLSGQKPFCGRVQKLAKAYLMDRVHFVNILNH